jgi:aspartate/methionine/tyrosine aminotransferase
MGCTVVRRLARCSMPSTSRSRDEFRARLERARASGLLPLDLAVADPARCGLGWDPNELEALSGAAAPARGSRAAALAGAREAIASYLAGHRASVRPDRIFFAPSPSVARKLALESACDPDGEVLAPGPARPFVEEGAGAARPPGYALEFGETWQIDRRSLRRAVGLRTRAVAIGNPFEPTGAMPGDDGIEFLDALCGAHGLALLGDEAFIETGLGPSASVARATRCVAVHVSGLSGVCGLPQLGAEWIAVAGPEALAAQVASRASARAEAGPGASDSALRAIPALLARRERFLGPLRARLARNRGAIVKASLREAPWTLQWGSGGCWAVLQINPVRDETELCLALLDEGVAVLPGHLDGLPEEGYLVASLLPDPDVFTQGLERLEAQLRRLA